jgi:hypothetical protein
MFVTRRYKNTPQTYFAASKLSEDVEAESSLDQGLMAMCTMRKQTKHGNSMHVLLRFQEQAKGKVAALFNANGAERRRA